MCAVGSPVQNTVGPVLRQLSDTSQNTGILSHRPSDPLDRLVINSCDKLSSSVENCAAAVACSLAEDVFSSDNIPNDLPVSSNRVMFRSIFQAGRASLSQGKRTSIVSSCNLPWPENNADEEIIENCGSHEHFDMSQPIEFSRQILSAREDLKRPARASQSTINETVNPVQSDNDKFWEQVELNVKSNQHPLKISDLDFTDVTEVDDEFYHSLQPQVDSNVVQNQVVASLRSIPPPPPPPPPPLPLMTDLQLSDGIPVPPVLPVVVSLNTNRSKKTVRLHWKEAKGELLTAGGRQADTIWDQMLREIGSVNIDTNKLEHLFETRTIDMKARVCLTLDYCIHYAVINMFTCT